MTYFYMKPFQFWPTMVHSLRLHPSKEAYNWSGLANVTYIQKFNVRMELSYFW